MQYCSFCTNKSTKWKVSTKIWFFIISTFIILPILSDSINGEEKSKYILGILFFIAIILYTQGREFYKCPNCERVFCSSCKEKGKSKCLSCGTDRKLLNIGKD
jgi:hypothetical protein